jgi:hypothetical protein
MASIPGTRAALAMREGLSAENTPLTPVNIKERLPARNSGPAQTLFY